MNLRDLVLDGAAAEPFRHYPEGDLYDPISRSQAYFHCHRVGENGHFHLFLRLDGPCHLGAAALDENGRPCALFTTNRWVTGETWRPAEELVRALPLFQLILPQARAALGDALTELVRSRRDDFARLLTERDRVLAARLQTASLDDVFEDQGLEIMSHMDLS